MHAAPAISRLPSEKPKDLMLLEGLWHADVPSLYSLYFLLKICLFCLSLRAFSVSSYSC